MHCLYRTLALSSTSRQSERSSSLANFHPVGRQSPIAMRFSRMQSRQPTNLLDVLPAVRPRLRGGFSCDIEVRGADKATLTRDYDAALSASRGRPGP